MADTKPRRLIRGQIHFAKSCGRRRKIIHVMHTDHKVFYLDMATQEKASCTVEEFLAWCRSPQIKTRKREADTRVCRSCRHRVHVSQMEVTIVSGGKYWACKKHNWH